MRIAGAEASGGAMINESFPNQPARPDFLQTFFGGFAGFEIAHLYVRFQVGKRAVATGGCPGISKSRSGNLELFRTKFIVLQVHEPSQFAPAPYFCHNAASFVGYEDA